MEYIVGLLAVAAIGYWGYTRVIKGSRTEGKARKAAKKLRER